MTFGTHIRSRREGLNLTRKQLSERLGISAFSIRQWEVGGIFPSATHIVPLAKALELDPCVLLDTLDQMTERKATDK